MVGAIAEITKDVGHAGHDLRKFEMSDMTLLDAGHFVQRVLEGLACMCRFDLRKTRNDLRELY